MIMVNQSPMISRLNREVQLINVSGIENVKVQVLIDGNIVQDRELNLWKGLS